MHGYWMVGSGKGGGMEVDSRIDRDSDGLPYIPGKMIKGMIKDACIRLLAAGNTNYNFVEQIFGSSGNNRTETKNGSIYISDARLPDNLRKALNMEEHLNAKTSLTRNIYSTAIYEKSGTAEDNSLRGTEVSVPMELTAHLELETPKDIEGNPLYNEIELEKILKAIELAATKLVYAIGAHKSRGLGEVEIKFEKEEA